MFLLALLLTFNLGDFRLESGEVIPNCTIGYRVDGTLNADRSNAILVTTWFAGKSADLASQVGPGKMYDTSKYFVVVADALGDGVSSSPSNSGGRLPRFTIRDMVRTQYELVTRELKLERLYCVAGSSMGGMQAFQWVMSYPDFVKKAIAITGTPKQTSHDILLWKTQLDLIESAEDKRNAMRMVAGIQSLELYTPAWIVKNVPEGATYLETRRKWFESLDPFDYMSQLRAMIAHDVGPVTSIKPRMLVVVALQDQMVNPTPAREFARVTGSDLVTLSGDCGHLASACESEVVTREVHRFLSETPR